MKKFAFFLYAAGTILGLSGAAYWLSNDSAEWDSGTSEFSFNLGSSHVLTIDANIMNHDTLYWRINGTTCFGYLSDSDVGPYFIGASSDFDPFISAISEISATSRVLDATDFMSSDLVAGLVHGGTTNSSTVVYPSSAFNTSGGPSDCAPNVTHDDTAKAIADAGVRSGIVGSGTTLEYALGAGFAAARIGMNSDASCGLSFIGDTVPLINSSRVGIRYMCFVAMIGAVILLGFVLSTTMTTDTTHQTLNLFMLFVGTAAISYAFMRIPLDTRTLGNTLSSTDIWAACSDHTTVSINDHYSTLLGIFVAATSCVGLSVIMLSLEILEGNSKQSKGSQYFLVE